MPIFQFDRHALHCVLGSVSSNSHNSMLPTSWIICSDSGLKGLNGWFCSRSCWRACRSGWFSIFWINSPTLVLCVHFTTECGSPGIRKCMYFLMTQTVMRDNGTLRSLMCLFNVEIISVFRWTYLDYTRLINGFSLSVLCEETSSSWKKFTSISGERDVFLSSCTSISSCVITGLPVRSRIGFRIGWFDWKLLDSCPASDRWACSEPNYLFHSCFKEIFGGSRGDMYTFV